MDEPGRTDVYVGGGAAEVAARTLSTFAECCASHRTGQLYTPAAVLVQQPVQY